MQRPVRVGITHGDLNGVSYEIILKTLDNEMLAETCTPVLFGSSKLIGYYRKVLGLEEVIYNQIHDSSEIKDGVCNLVNISDEEFKVEMGRPSQESGRAALMSLEQAIQALKSGDIDVLVTAPISKEAMKEAGFNYPGHTEFLESRLGGDGDKTTMILCDSKMRIALLTTHIPIKEVSNAVKKDIIKDKLHSIENSLKIDFAIPKPKIAVLALNPHCGDNGVCGTEELDEINPAIEECIADNMLVFGPFGADGFFGSGAYLKYDAILAMYHDQGLIPFKSLRVEPGVNFTAGLRYVRTSPDHGTGYDITGRNMADDQAFRNAIYRAIDIYRNRKKHAEITSNPLQKQYVERGNDKSVDLTKEELNED